MKITVLTTACHRPEAWTLCEGYIKAQTRQPDQWLVLDDDDPATVCTLKQQYHYWPEFRGRGSLTRKVTRAVNENLITGDALVFIENDDAYNPTYLENVEKWLQQADIVGEGDSVYYNVQHRKWFSHKNHQHASLCSTALRRSVFPLLLKAANTDDPYIDWRLWNMVNHPLKKKVWMPQDHLPNGRLCVGMKGMPGKLGYGTGHTVEWMKGCTPDPQLVKLTQMMGKDAEAYRPFYLNHSQEIMDTKKYLSPTDQGHGDKWEKWLGHLIGKPAIGLEIGTFRGESAEVMLTRVFTHPDSFYICIDPFTGSPEHALNKIDCSKCESDTRDRLSKFGKKVIIHKDESRVAIKEYMGRRDLDFVYVDGAHDSMNTLRDGVMAFEGLKVGGIMIFDDLTWKGMPDPIDCTEMAIRAFMQCYAKQIQVIGADSQLGLRKIA